MSQKYIRVYQKIDPNDLKEHTLIYGDLSASCSKCKTIDIKLEAEKCPSCQTDYKYITFRNIKNNLPKINKLSETRPNLFIVDYDDYKRLLGALQAQEFLK